MNTTTFQSIIFFTYTHTQSTTAAATFVTVAEHTFNGVVYDGNATALTAKMYVYGFKRDSLPANYKPIFQSNNVESMNGSIDLEKLLLPLDDVDMDNSSTPTILLSPSSAATTLADVVSSVVGGTSGAVACVGGTFLVIFNMMLLLLQATAFDGVS